MRRQLALPRNSVGFLRAVAVAESFLEDLGVGGALVIAVVGASARAVVDFPPSRWGGARRLTSAWRRLALGAALLTALYGARSCRYELRRGYLAESDAHQVAFSAALVSFDLSVVLATLRRAPFAAFPFVVWNVLS